jgi:hypothetical protein
VQVRFREPSLLELLKDPLVRLVMARDGVTDAALRKLICTIQHGRRTPHDSAR